MDKAAFDKAALADFLESIATKIQELSLGENFEADRERALFEMRKTLGASHHLVKSVEEAQEAYGIRLMDETDTIRNNRWARNRELLTKALRNAARFLRA